jgi:hypothetical protein
MTIAETGVLGRVRRLVESRRFQVFVLGVIVMNAILMGLETSASLVREYRPAVHGS